MRNVALRLFRASLALLPRSLRDKYGMEMEDVVAERMREHSSAGALLLAVDEMRDIGVIAVRAQFERAGVGRGSVAAAVVTAMIFTAVVFRYMPLTTGAASDAPARMDVSAHDPAGQFTLTIFDGHAPTVTMNHVALSPDRVVQHGDSIHVLSASGQVVLALAYYPETGRIAWDARPAACRSNPAECELY